MKTAELQGALLDYHVARAEHEMNPRFEDGLCIVMAWTIYAPSTDWLIGGRLIEKYGMYVEWDADGYWAAATKALGQVEGDTPLQAICRAVVRAAFGDEVGEVGDA